MAKFRIFLQQVVNKDQSATYNGQKDGNRKTGRSNLKDNDSLDFHFVDEKAAKDGLKNGDYYMIASTLPEDLFRKLAPCNQASEQR